MKRKNHHEKLFDLIRKGEFNQFNCFEWKGPKDKNGYGITTYSDEGKKKKTVKVHRLIWTILQGDIPKEMLICHACDNPKCFNINHLFLGTPKDNSKDRDAKGHGPFHNQKGESNFSATLTECTVLKIRKLYSEGWRICEIVKEFGINQPTVNKIVHRQRWKHI